MLKSYALIAWRNLLRNKGFSVINISGLAIGMASALLILLWVQHEFSIDSYYPNAKNIYLCYNKDRGEKGIVCWDVTSKPLAPALKLEYPEVERATRVNWNESILLEAGDKKLNSTSTMADPDFLYMFSFPFIAGDRRTALSHPDDIILTESLSRKLFNATDVVGKTVRLDNKYDFKVSAVMNDLPANSTFSFEFICPWSFMHTRNEDDTSWQNNSTHNYVQLKANVDAAAFNQKIAHEIRRHGYPKSTQQAFIYPITQLYLHGNFDASGNASGGRIITVQVFTIIAVFILLIACINFMNMSTARSEKRAREVGIRKVSGALRGSLIAQFIGESILIAALAGTIAAILVVLVLPVFSAVLGEKLSLDAGITRYALLFTGFVLVTGLLAGSYPAFFLSSFKPVAVLKGTFKRANALVAPRKILVVLQFTFAITLIVCTIVITRQVKYAQDRQLGYRKDNLVYSFLSGDIRKNYALIRNEMINSGAATAMTMCSSPLTQSWSSGSAQWPGKDPNVRINFHYYSVNDAITQTAGFQLKDGRDFDLANFPTDSTAVILNEAAVQAMNLKNPVGQIINPGHWNSPEWHIIGVVKDFILLSPYANIQPMIIQGPRADRFGLVHVRLNAGRTTSQSLADMERIFKKYNPAYPFEYNFTDKEYAKKFAGEQTAGTLTLFFAGLTIFISCLGLFGLAAYMAENRIKEIGVRKVLGATVTGIATLLSRDFIKLVFISIFIASPLAWWSMNSWLSNFNYRINISWWIFAVAGIMAILIAIITVSFQAIKAGLANPVKSLRTE